MNENLNLMDILKECPQGTKLYSTVHGEVEFCKITDNKFHPISFNFRSKCGEHCTNNVTADGKYYFNSNGECILFPSKEQRDWSKFKVEPEMIDGEFYYCSSNLTEDGFIFIYEKHMSYKTKCYAAISIPSFVLFKNDIITNNENITKLRKATEEEKQQLLDAIKVRNYEWDANKKELVRIEKKLDISSLQHFDRVLVRDDDTQKWKCDFYDSYVKEMKCPFRTTYSWFKQCIPYNNETMHLVSSTKIPPEKYITWEE